MITIYKDAWRDAYMADMSQATDVEKIKELFGSTTIPTAYTLRADVATVQRHLQSLNPHDHVLIDGFIYA